MKEYQKFYEKKYNNNSYFLMSTKNERRKLVVDFLVVQLAPNIFMLHVLENSLVTKNYLLLDLAKMEKVKVKMGMKCSFFYHDINGRFQNKDSKDIIDPYIQVHAQLKYNTFAEYKNAKKFIKNIKGIK